MLFRYLFFHIIILIILNLVAGEEEYNKNVTVCIDCTDICSAYPESSKMTIDSLCYQGNNESTNYEYNFDPAIPDTYLTSCSTCASSGLTFFVR